MSNQSLAGQMHSWSSLALGAFACLAFACASDNDGAGGVDPTNNGGTNNTNLNNGDPNNGDPNNDDPNNDDPNNGDPNNGDPNNGDPNNGDPNNGMTNNGDPNNGAPNVVYYGDIDQILANNCLSCHVPDGAGPFPLDSFDNASLYAESAQWAINEGIMPPWKADPSCREHQGARLMPESDKARFDQWVTQGKQAGDPANAGVYDIQPSVIDDPDVVTASSEAYTPNANRPDDYRCLVMDAEFSEDKLLTGLHMLPDVKAMVHHGLIWVIPPQSVGQILDRDANDPGAGYTCFGASGGNGQLVGVWVPGAVPTWFPEGAAYPIEAGSRFVVQIHYNTVNGVLEADQSQLQLKFTDQEPSYRVSMPILLGGVNIGAGDTNAEGFGSWTNTTNQSIFLVSAMPHMHLLGKEIDLWVTRDGQANECVVDIKDWDFDWQQFYQLPDNDWEELAPGDGVGWRCVWDNGPDNQPVINGEQIEPRDVRFGEGTYDEMCIQILTLLVPIAQGGAGTCAGAESCASSCDPSDPYCTISCMDAAGPDCAECVAYGLGGCANARCPGELGSVVSCIQPCFTGDNLSECVAEGTACADEWATFYSCIGPELDSGACNMDLRDCDLEF